MKVNVLVLALLLAAVVPASAGSHPAKADKPLPPSLSRDELRACMKEEDSLQQRHDALEKAHAEHDAQLADALAEALTLSEQMRNIDKYDAAAVDEYNRRTKRRNDKVDALNKQADAMNGETQVLQGENADYTKRCVARPFLRSDEDAILKEQGRTSRTREPKRQKAPTGDKEA